MFTQKEKVVISYREDAMTKPVCLICGEHIGDYVYRGKSVCSECLKYIKTNC